MKKIGYNAFFSGKIFVAKSCYRIVQGDYYDGFKLQVFPDQATQDLVRETNLLQNEIYDRVVFPSRALRQKLKEIKPKLYYTK